MWFNPVRGYHDRSRQPHLPLPSLSRQAVAGSMVQRAGYCRLNGPTCRPGQASRGPADDDRVNRGSDGQHLLGHEPGPSLWRIPGGPETPQTRVTSERSLSVHDATPTTCKITWFWYG